MKTERKCHSAQSRISFSPERSTYSYRYQVLDLVVLLSFVFCIVCQLLRVPFLTLVPHYKGGEMSPYTT